MGLIPGNSCQCILNYWFGKLWSWCRMEEIALILPPPPFPQPPNPFNMNHFCLELNLTMFLLTQINSLLECGRAGLFFSGCGCSCQIHYIGTTNCWYWFTKKPTWNAEVTQRVRPHFWRTWIGDISVWRWVLAWNVTMIIICCLSITVLVDSSNLLKLLPSIWWRCSHNTVVQEALEFTSVAILYTVVNSC